LVSEDTISADRIAPGSRKVAQAAEFSVVAADILVHAVPMPRLVPLLTCVSRCESVGALRVSLRRGGLSALSISAALAIASSVGACAKPCVDDGWGQKECPEEEEAEASEAEADMADDAEDDPDGPEVGTGDGLDCPILEVALDPKPVTIVFLVDQSGSMTATFDQDTGVNRWDAVETTLFDDDIGIAPKYDDRVRFGLTLYTNVGSSMTCPDLSVIDPDLENNDAMRTLYMDNAPGGDTPTGESLHLVADTLAADTGAIGEKIIILATDGEPDTCAVPNPQLGQPEALEAAEYAFGLGITTKVISVGDEVSDEHLQDMANAGQGVGPGDPQATFYKALDSVSLAAALEDIVSSARECRLALDTELMAGLVGQCQVEVNGSVIPYDTENGWRLNDPFEIELVGFACDDIQDGEVTVEMACDCDAVEN